MGQKPGAGGEVQLKTAENTVGEGPEFPICGAESTAAITTGESGTQADNITITSINITSTRPDAETQMTIDHSRVEAPEKELKFPFIIPNKYERK